MTSEQKKAEIAALLVERAGYLQYGREERAAEVDAQLARLGHKGAAPAKRASRMTPPPHTEL
jgi:hypothetical protein